MITNDLPITYTVVWSLALANVFGAGLCIFLSGGIARLTTIRFPLLAPFLLMMISFAAFQSKQTLWDLTALVVIGMLGIFMRRFEWPRPAFLIGFVLADQAEVYTYQATQIALSRLKLGWGPMLEYIFSPTALTLLAITVISVWLGARQSASLKPPTTTTATQQSKIAPIVFTTIIAVFLAVNLVDSIKVSVLIDKVFPIAVSGFTLLATLILLFRSSTVPADHVMVADHEIIGEDAGAPRGVWSTLSWLVLLLALTALFGFIIALVAFFVMFLRIRAATSWLQTLLLTAGGLSGLLVMAGALHRDFPPGLLQGLFDLPWPFR
jgi:hypothetical protein